jgi:hypothetical protein
MSIDITQLSSEVSGLILAAGVSGNLIALVQGEQGEQGDQGLQGNDGIGITSGGLSGQFLIKAGTADYETQWASLTITSGLIGGVYVDTPSNGQALVWDDANQYFTNRDVSGSSSSSSSAASTSITVTQAAHGLTTGQVVYYNGSIWRKAQADSTSTLGIGIVQYLTPNTFNVVFSGQVSGFSGLSAGNYYFVSDSLSGGLTYNEPTISNPLVVAVSTTAGIVIPWRPVDNSAFQSDYVSVTAGVFTVSQLVDYIYCDCSLGGITASLLSVADIPGKAYTFKKLDSSSVNNIKIQPDGSELLESGSNYTLTGQYSSITIGNNGVQWYIHNIYRA